MKVTHVLLFLAVILVAWCVHFYMGNNNTGNTIIESNGDGNEFSFPVKYEQEVLTVQAKLDHLTLTFSTVFNNNLYQSNPSDPSLGLFLLQGCCLVNPDFDPRIEIKENGDILLITESGWFNNGISFVLRKVVS